MPLDKKRFAVVFLAANVLLVGVGASIALGGVAVAVPTAGVGGFTVTFDELQGQGFTQYATIENNSDCAAYPATVAQIESGYIKGLHLYKDVTIPEGMPGGGDTIRLSVKSDQKAEFTGLTQKATYIGADLTFKNGQRIEAGAPSASVQDALSITSPSVVIADAKIKAQSQFVQSITLPGTEVTTTVNPEQRADFPQAACAASNGS
ncbi:DUF6230 family protein [Halomarina litorea]|uniref:DUF6230 family protein n=1 Tax=Halomarina litorea TaxID=2961595 RepID=UPI0020C2F364|nr:DUF6230 family protein [Halomarina sp. BCD28]